ncbi:protein-disulfide reductase DsbD [Chitinilyticum litopenaei]|uniref:protein-disulfide reductase DsbD n=1 Tax=Chitinilyticum litopenaei TaxID=1121276 RepID=UPI0003FC2F27|nr:protein-disulfide reductase DsbD [Chitinilyticum litopenaei]
MHALKTLLFWLIPLLLLGTAHAVDPDTLLKPEEAFQPSARLVDNTHISVQWQVAKGYYLYRDRIRVSHDKQDLALDFPAGIVKDDPYFGRTEVYPQDVALIARSPRTLQASDRIELTFQGCAEAGICYPPQTVSLTLDGRSSTTGVAGLFGVAGKAETPDESGFFGGSLAITLGLFLLAGLGLSFTACLYPLIPIVSTIILGQQGISRQRSLLLTLSYIQGMALSYAAAGMAAAASGTLLVVALQQPWVTALFAGFFVLMALAMFGVFSLQLPSSLQSHIQKLGQRLPGGHYGSVFVMGVLSAVLVGPCMAPPLAAALAYIGRSGDLLTGGLSLYSLALGMGAPLLLIGGFGASILPRLSGTTMNRVRRGFGVILLLVAVWVAQPLWYPRLAEPASSMHLTVRSGDELDRALQQARGKPVLVDVYADWCVSCIELERKTFPDPTVKQALREYVLIRADVTRNDDEAQGLLRRFGLYGPPAILFYDRAGQLHEKRLIGFQPPAALIAGLPAEPAR